MKSLGKPSALNTSPADPTHEKPGVKRLRLTRCFSIAGMAPVILNFDKKQSFVLVNSQKVHCFGGMQRFAYFFMRQMLIILDHIPLGSLEIEVYAAFLNIIHIG